jgi:hypothetical protein
MIFLLAATSVISGCAVRHWVAAKISGKAVDAVTRNGPGVEILRTTDQPGAAPARMTAMAWFSFANYRHWRGFRGGRHGGRQFAVQQRLYDDDIGLFLLHRWLRMGS